MAAGERAPVVGTSTLIATPSASAPWRAGADAQLFVWNARPSEPDTEGCDPTVSVPAPIARVASVESLAAALRCGVEAVWPEPTVGSLAALRAYAAPNHDHAQLIVDVDTGTGSHPHSGVVAELVRLAGLGTQHGVAPDRLAMAIRAEPRSDVPAALRAWRSDARLRCHPLIVAIPTETSPAVRSGLVAAAAMAGASVATADVRGARRVIEVVHAITSHQDMQRHTQTGELR